MLNEIIAIYAITDDLLKAIDHKEDYRGYIASKKRMFLWGQSHQKPITRNLG